MASPIDTVVLLGAMRAEMEILKPFVTMGEERSVQGTRFLLGQIGGTPVALAWAGVGKVNAAMTTTLSLCSFGVRAVVLAGVAGATDPDLVPGDIILGEEVGHHDFGMVNEQGFTAWQTWNPLSGEKNPPFFAASAELVQVGMARAEGLALDEVVEGLKRLPTVRAGRIGTGDIVAATPAKRRELFERYGVQACEMEGAGVAQVCHQHAVPWLVIRGITDTADYIPSDFEAVARRVTGQVAAFTTGLVADLAGRDQGGERPRGEALL